MARNDCEGGSLQVLPLYSNRQLMCVCGVEAAEASPSAVMCLGGS